MNFAQLKTLTAEHEPNYFNRDSMKFFGDYAANYGVRDGGMVRSQYDADGKFVIDGANHDVWELYRKSPVRAGLKDSVYFSKWNGRQVRVLPKAVEELF